MKNLILKMFSLLFVILIPFSVLTFADDDQTELDEEYQADEIDDIDVVLPNTEIELINPLVEESDKPVVISKEEQIKMDDQNQQIFKKLESFGIMRPDNDGADPDELIDRATFATLMVRIIGRDEVALNSDYEQSFNDVSIDNWSYKYINYVTKLGIMVGTGVDTFSPNSIITYEQAIKVIVNILGYELKAEGMGGYPGGYMSVAANLGILDRIKLNNKSELKRSEIANIINNALNVEIYTQSSFGKNPIFQKVTGGTLLKEWLHIFTDTGQVSGTYMTRLDTGDSYLKENEVLINGKIFLLGTTNTRDYFGYKVKYYYTEDFNLDERTLIYVETPKTENLSMNIKSNDILNYANHILTYEGKDNVIRTLKLSGNIDVIYNGKAKLNYTDEDLMPKNGSIQLLDIDGDKSYDVIFVISYINYVVESVSIINDKITDKYGMPDLILNGTGRLLEYEIVKNGKTIEIDALKEWDILSIMADQETVQNGRRIVSPDAKHLIINVIDKQIKGRIDEINVDEAIINGKIYEVSLGLKLVISDAGIFYLDMDDKIAAYKKDTLKNGTYAYLLEVGTPTNSFSEDKIKILDIDNNIKELKLAEDVSLNNEKKESSREVIKKEILREKQLIIYGTNKDGEVNRISTAVEPVNSRTPGDERDEYVLELSGKNATRKYKSSPKSFAGACFYGSNTITFLVPKNGDIEEFTVVKDVFTNDKSYEISFYNVSSALVPDVIVYNEADLAVAANSSILLVDKITKSVGEDGDIKNKLYGLYNGTEIGIEVAETLPLTVKKGDALQYLTNKNGEISMITILRDDLKEFSNDDFKWEAIGSFAAAKELVCGQVFRKSVNTIRVNINKNKTDADIDPLLDLRNYSNIHKAKIYLYDTIKNEVSVVTSNEICKDDIVFLRVSYAVVKDVIIIR